MENVKEKVHTSTLMRRIFKTKKLDTFLEENSANFAVEGTFRQCLQSYCKQKGLIPERVIQSAQIARTYGHQLFNGTRQPSRDKVLQLAIAMGLTVEETQRLLIAADKGILYPRVRRDAVIIYGLKEKYSVMDVQEALDHYQLTLLGGDTGDA